MARTTRGTRNDEGRRGEGPRGPRDPVHRLPGLHRHAARPAHPGARAGRAARVPRAGEVPRPGAPLGRGDRGEAPPRPRAASASSRATSPRRAWASRRSGRASCAAACASAGTSPLFTTSPSRRDVGRRINVEGTKNVLEFVGEAPAFERLQYVSTAYVSGTAPRAPSARPTSTSARASRTTTRRRSSRPRWRSCARSCRAPSTGRASWSATRRRGRPASSTGPYHVLRLMEKLPSPGIFFRIGLGFGTVNIVPVDFVVESLAALSSAPASLGQDLPPVRPAAALARRARRDVRGGDRKELRRTCPCRWRSRRRSSRPKPVQRLFGMPLQALDYFDDPVRHDAAQATKDLGRAGHRVPAPGRLHAAARRVLPRAPRRGAAGGDGLTAKGAAGPADAEQAFPVEGPYDFDESTRFVPFGPYDPTCRRGPGVLWKAGFTPEGPVTLRLRRASDGVRAAAWGGGASWAVARAGALVGLDDPGGFAPGGVLAPLARRHRGLRLPRSPFVFDGLVEYVLQQRVSFRDASRSYRRLVALSPRRRPGRPACGCRSRPPPGLRSATTSCAGPASTRSARRPCAPRRARPGPWRRPSPPLATPPAPAWPPSGAAGRGRSRSRWGSCSGDPDAVPIGRPAPAARGGVGAGRGAARGRQQDAGAARAVPRPPLPRAAAAAGRRPDPPRPRVADVTGRPPSTGAAGGRGPGGRRTAGAAGRSTSARG